MSTFDAPGLTDPDAPSSSASAPGDPDLDAPGADVSDLEAIAEELTDDTTITPETVIPVSTRQGYALRCRIDYTGRDLDNLRKQAKDRRFVDGIDGAKFYALLFALTCTAILRNGQEVTDNGDVVTFTSPGLQRTFGTADAQSTVRKLFSLEGPLEAAFLRLQREAGWGEETYAMDPMK